MNSWGMSVTGLSNARALLDQVEMEWSGDTLYLVGPTVAYAVFQELGTSSQEARPFMRPAAERVSADPLRYARQYADGSIDNEHQLIAGVALAIEAEAKKIASQKGVRDTGTLINSIEARRVR